MLKLKIHGGSTQEEQGNKVQKLVFHYRFNESDADVQCLRLVQRVEGGGRSLGVSRKGVFSIVPNDVDVDGLVPSDGLSEALFEGPLSLEAELFEFRAVNVVAKVIEGAIGDSFEPFGFVLQVVGLQQSA